MNTWGEIAEAVADAPYPSMALPATAANARTQLEQLGVSAESWLGAVVFNSGGLLIDHGWLRVLGSGYNGLPDVSSASNGMHVRGIMVGLDVLGGQFCWYQSDGPKPTVHYFEPDTLSWRDLRLGYGEWLIAMISGAVPSFYQGLRWPSWESEVDRLAPGTGIQSYPPLWTSEGKDIGTASRREIGLSELVAIHYECAQALDGHPDSIPVIIKPF